MVKSLKLERNSKVKNHCKKFLERKTRGIRNNKILRAGKWHVYPCLRGQTKKLLKKKELEGVSSLRFRGRAAWSEEFRWEDRFEEENFDYK